MTDQVLRPKPTGMRVGAGIAGLLILLAWFVLLLISLNASVPEAKPENDGMAVVAWILLIGPPILGASLLNWAADPWEDE